MNTSNESSIYNINNILHITSTTVNVVLGVPINGCVLWLVLTGPAGTLASEILTLNLSLFEIIYWLLAVIFLIKPSNPFRKFTVAFLFTGRPLFQSCIGVERFMAVVHPVLFLKYKPLRYRVACSVLAWLLIIAVSLLFLLLDVFGYGKIVHYLRFGECLFFMSVMLLCSLAILRALKQPVPGEMGRERARDNSMKRRAFTIICLIMVSFVVTFFTWGLIAILNSQRYLTDVMEIMRPTCMLITGLTGLVQPLLYLGQKTGKLPCIKPVQGTG